MTFHDLRHLNASVMAALRIPDKYAQERGGWKSDKIMKTVYTQTFSEIRTAVDDKIDGYFDNIANQSTGTKMPRADWKLVSVTEFCIPKSLDEQAQIGQYFCNLDTLITLHQRKPNQKNDGGILLC